MTGAVPQFQSCHHGVDRDNSNFAFHYTVAKCDSGIYISLDMTV